MMQETYTRVPNTLIEAVIRSDFFSRKTRLFFILIRKLNGWNKEEDYISLSQFAKYTGLAESNISTVLTQLHDANIIRKRGNLYKKYKINNCFEEWQGLSEEIIQLIRSENNYYQKPEESLSNTRSTKETSSKEIFSNKTLTKGGEVFENQENQKIVPTELAFINAITKQKLETEGKARDIWQSYQKLEQDDQKKFLHQARFLILNNSGENISIRNQAEKHFKEILKILNGPNFEFEK